MSAAEMAFALEEAGATSLCAPLLSTAALAVPLLLAATTTRSPCTPPAYARAP